MAEVEDSDDLKSILDDITKPVTTRGARARRPDPFIAPPRPKPMHTYEEVLKEAYRTFHAEPTPSRPSKQEGTFTVSSRMVDTKSETAVLSVNPAKCCISMRAVLNDTVMNDLRNEIGEKRMTLNYDRSCFEFHPDLLPKLQLVLHRHYAGVSIIGVPKPVPASKFDKLLSKLDKDDKAKVYRLLAAKYHPDRGGSNEIMTMVNEVFKQ